MRKAGQGFYLELRKSGIEPPDPEVSREGTKDAKIDRGILRSFAVRS
jgi:hypothetical protein